ARGPVMRRRIGSILAAGICLVICAAATGQIVTDGKLGAVQSLSGASVNIPAGLGRRMGNNLFHSFSAFNIQTNQTVTFDGPARIKTVLAGVTGGRGSSIDGTLGCSIAGADVYFINPAGVVMGPNAQLNLSGSFIVTTADTIKLKGGGHFDA